MPLSDYKKVLVTGASSGIGQALVQRLSGQGLEVHALARREDRLSELAASTGCTPLALDLRDTDALYSRLENRTFTFTAQKWIRVGKNRHFSGNSDKLHSDLLKIRIDHHIDH